MLLEIAKLIQRIQTEIGGNVNVSFRCDSILLAIFYISVEWIDDGVTHKVIKTIHVDDLECGTWDDEKLITMFIGYCKVKIKGVSKEDPIYVVV